MKNTLAKLSLLSEIAKGFVIILDYFNGKMLFYCTYYC
jgi:hypothetical protein